MHVNMDTDKLVAEFSAPELIAAQCDLLTQALAFNYAVMRRLYGEKPADTTRSDRESKTKGSLTPQPSQYASFPENSQRRVGASASREMEVPVMQPFRQTPPNLVRNSVGFVGGLSARGSGQLGHSDAGLLWHPLESTFKNPSSGPEPQTWPPSIRSDDSMTVGEHGLQAAAACGPAHVDLSQVAAKLLRHKMNRSPGFAQHTTSQSMNRSLAEPLLPVCDGQSPVLMSGSSGARQEPLSDDIDRSLVEEKSTEVVQNASNGVSTSGVVTGVRKRDSQQQRGNVPDPGLLRRFGSDPELGAPKRHSSKSNAELEAFGKRDGSISQSEKKKTKRPTNALLPSVEEIKRMVGGVLFKKAYNVEDYYHEHGCCQLIARNSRFNNFTMIVITLNTLWIAIDTDYNKADVLCNAAMVFQVVDNAFCAYFVFEILARFFAFESKCFAMTEAWFVFDSFLVTLMVWETWAQVALYYATGGMIGGGDTRSSSILRVFRVFRLTRIARMARLLRSIPELLILIQGLVLALRSVSVTICFLFLVIYIYSIAFVQLLSDSKLPGDPFASVPQAMNFLLLQVIAGFDADFMKIMLGCGHLYYALLLSFVLVGSFTIMNMLIGILCEVVSNVSQVSVEATFLKEVEFQVAGILDTLDQDGSSSLDKEEFDELTNNHPMMVSLHELGVDVVAFVDFANYIFHTSAEWSFHDFLETVVQFRGSKAATVKDIVDMRKFVSMELTGMEHRIDFRLDVAEAAALGSPGFGFVSPNASCGNLPLIAAQRSKSAA